MRDSYLTVWLCHSTDARRAGAAKGCEPALDKLQLRAPAAAGA